MFCAKLPDGGLAAYEILGLLVVGLCCCVLDIMLSYSYVFHDLPKRSSSLSLNTAPFLMFTDADPMCQMRSFSGHGGSAQLATRGKYKCMLSAKPAREKN